MSSDACKLKENSIGFWGVVFYAVAVIFSAGAFAVTGVTAMTYGGETAPLTFLIGGITLFFVVKTLVTAQAAGLERNSGMHAGKQARHCGYTRCCQRCK